MSEYQKAMLHIELALRRVSDALRQGGETNTEDALHAVAEEIASLVEEERQVSIKTAQGEQK
jgi:hypothetical protein